MVERNCRQARRFGDALRAAGFDVLNDVVLNQVLVSFGTLEQTQAYGNADNIGRREARTATTVWYEGTY
jgi:hypothetical protein